MPEPALERVLVYDRIGANRRNTLLLLAVFAVLVLPLFAYGAGYLLFWVLLLALGLGALLGENWLTALVLAVLVAGAVLCLAAYLQSRYGSSLVLRLARARPLASDQEPGLEQTVENLCIGAGLPEPALYVIESAPPNAFSTGWDPEHASLVVTRSLLRLLDRRELEAVVAHELSHIGNHDTRLSTLAAIGVAILRLPLVIVVGIFRYLFRLHWVVGAAALLYLALPLLLSFVGLASELGSDSPILPWPWLLITMLFPFYVLFGAPLVGQFTRMAMLRERDFLADADAFLLTRNPEALALALAKMAAARAPRSGPGGATAHLYTADPLPEDAPWWDRILRAHPPVKRRIEALLSMGNGVPPSALRAAEAAGAEFRRAAPPADATDTGSRSAWQPAAKGEAPDEGTRTPDAFRLTGDGAVLYTEPTAAASPMGRLPSGALVMVLGEEGDFLHVLTADDTFGYVRRTEPMTEVELDDAGTERGEPAGG